MHPIHAIIHRFVQQYIDPTRPLLLAVSGGVDSLALFEAFYACKQLQIGIAHVDHGWRVESAAEAAALQSYVESKKIKFHSLRLAIQECKGNLEEVCRQKRYFFFKTLCDTHGYQGVATGHHAGDQEETVLKRILEGAHLKHLAGILPVRELLDVRVFRPLLEMQKKELESFISQFSLSPIIDPTNADQKFLRARLRHTIVPHLAEQFGKTIGSNLVYFAKNMREVNDYIEKRIECYLLRAVDGPLGCYLDLQTHRPNEQLEMKYLVTTFLWQRKIFFSREQLHLVVDLLNEKKAHKILQNAHCTVVIDRGILFIPSIKKQEAFLERKSLQMGLQNWGMWKVTRNKAKYHTTTSWRECWKGEISLVLPEGEYEIGSAAPQASYKGKIKLSKWWSQHKVPAFLYERVPVIWQEGQVVHEFLSGAS